MGWLSGWDYRKSIDISRPSGAVTDYQMNIQVRETSGSEFVTNGTFDSGTTGWTTNSCTIASVAGGVSGNCCQLTRTSGTQQFAYQALTLTLGRRYKLSAYFKSGTSGADNVGVYVYPSDWAWNGSVLCTTSGEWTKVTSYFVAYTASVNIAIYKLTGTAGTTLFDDVSLKECDVDCNGHCLTTFDDLRFTKSDGVTLLDNWTEYVTGTSPNKVASVWVEFDSIGTNDTTFYMYYGKNDASSYSNILNTFIFADDFEYGTVGSNLKSDWVPGTYTGKIATDRYRSPTRSAKMPGVSGNYPQFSKAITIDANKYISCKVNHQAFHTLTYYDGVSGKYIHVWYNWGTIGYYNGSSYVKLGKGGTNQWYTINIYNMNFSAGTFILEVPEFGVYVQGGMAQSTAGSPSYIAYGGSNSSIYTVWFDDIFVGNYNSVSPTLGIWGDEELAPTIVPQILVCM